MSSRVNHTSIEGKSDRAFVLRKIMSYGVGTKFDLRTLIDDVQSERDISDRQILGVLRRYNGVIVQGHREDTARTKKWIVLIDA